ncbi:MAG: hypothetical protein OEV23_03460 [Gallionella sp.]|nr:hypothetical protein [Gallionella sp.]
MYLAGSVNPSKNNYHIAHEKTAPNGYGKDVTPYIENRHARFPHLNPLPLAGEEANEALREFHVDADAVLFTLRVE